MATSVNTIHEIVKWAEELPDWQSDALRRIFLSGELSETDKEEILNIAKHTNGITIKPSPPAAIPFTASHAPGQSSSTEIIFLKKIHDVKHVNALAGDQVVKFRGKGVTVIYGDNGTGKSGYSRLLKRACRARHTESILPNIHKSTASHSAPEAIFDVHGDTTGSDSSLTWKEGHTTPDELSQIAVFDTHCARIFVDEANAVNYIPYGLDVFPKFANLFDELKSTLVGERTQLQTRDSILDELQGEHAVGEIINSLSAQTDVSTIEKLSTLSEEEQKEFEKLDTAVKDLKANDPQKQATVIRRTKLRISQLKDDLTLAFNLINNDSISFLKKLWDDAKAKAEAAKLASSQQFSGEPLPGVGSDAWREMYKHAKEYSQTEAYPGKEFPVTGDGSHCPLCMQELSTDAENRLKRFEKYIADKTEQEAAYAKKQFIASFKTIKEMVAPKIDNSLKSEINDLDNKTVVLITKALEDLDIRKKSILNAVKSGDWDSLKECDTNVVSKLNELIDDLETQAKDKDKLVDLDKQKKLFQEHNELLARKKLNKHKALVIDYIDNLKTSACLTSIINTLNSRTISTKANKLSQLVLTSELKSSIDTELASLNISHINLGLKPSSPKGTTKHQLIISDANNSDKLTSILSEGEQRVIAIASFLGELALSPKKTGIVFDDPVSSLDHKWSERIASRLVMEGSERQVIIFTHNMSFLLALYKHAAKQQVEISSQSLRRFNKISGQCQDELPWAARNASKRKDKLHDIAQQARAAYKVDPDSEEYKDLHDKFNSHLRSTWERVVEETLLNGVVMRFDSGVSTQLLNGVVVDDEDYHDVFHAMSGSSEGIDAHDHAASQHEQLKSPDELDAEITKLKQFRSRITKKQKDTIQRRKDSVKAPTHEIVA